MTQVPEASHGLQNPLEHSVPPYSQSNCRGAVSAGSGNQYPCPCGLSLLVPMVAGAAASLLTQAPLPLSRQPGAQATHYSSAFSLKSLSNSGMLCMGAGL